MMEGQNRKSEQPSIRDKVIDIHLHIGGIGNSSPCKMSKKFLHSPAYLYMVLRSGISMKELLKNHDTVLQTTMIEGLNNAPGIDFGVFLAFDSVYRENGEIDEENSNMVTPNNYVMDIARDNPKVLLGASVHPNRGETEGTEELSKMFDEAESRGWNLYADVSAICTLFRASIIDDILEKIPQNRMVLGSDYPIPVDNMPPKFIETLTLKAI